jgi:hypothetical protein
VGWYIPKHSTWWGVQIRVAYHHDWRYNIVSRDHDSIQRTYTQFIMNAGESDYRIVKCGPPPDCVVREVVAYRGCND